MSHCELSCGFACTEREPQRLAGPSFVHLKSKQGRSRKRDMGERFVVVPVEVGGGVSGEREHSDSVVADPAPSTGGSGREGEQEAGEDSVFEQQDPNALVPILTYNREPNKYGKTDDRFYSVSHFLSIYRRISCHLDSVYPCVLCDER